MHQFTMWILVVGEIFEDLSLWCKNNNSDWDILKVKRGYADVHNQWRNHSALIQVTVPSVDYELVFKLQFPTISRTV